MNQIYILDPDGENVCIREASAQEMLDSATEKLTHMAATKRAMDAAELFGIKWFDRSVDKFPVRCSPGYLDLRPKAQRRKAMELSQLVIDLIPKDLNIDPVPTAPVVLSRIPRILQEEAFAIRPARKPEHPARPSRTRGFFGTLFAFFFDW